MNKVIVFSLSCCVQYRVTRAYEPEAREFNASTIPSFFIETNIYGTGTLSVKMHVYHVYKIFEALSELVSAVTDNG